MRSVILAAAAALILSAQIATVAKADETTVIRKDRPYEGSSTTVIKKREGVDLLPIPHRTEEKKLIIHRED